MTGSYVVKYNVLYKNGPIYRTLATTLLRFKLLPVYNTFWTSLSVIRKKTVLDVFDILSCRYIIIRYQGDGDFIILVQDIALGCISLRFNKIMSICLFPTTLALFRI